MKNMISKIVKIVEKEMQCDLTDDVQIAIIPNEDIAIVVSYVDEEDGWTGCSTYYFDYKLSEEDIEKLIERLRRRFAYVRASKFYHDLIPNKLTLQYLIIVSKYPPP